MAGQQYQIRIVNNSKIDNQNAIVFQQQPDLPSDVYSLAWLSKMCHAGTWIDFDWTIDYNFVWGQEGDLKPGVNYKAGQVVPADFTVNSKVTLLYDGGFKFGPTVQGPTPGNSALYVSQPTGVPGYDDPNQGSVGIGMSGSGTYVTPTSSDGAGGTQFTINPVYWVAFGSHLAGTVVTQDILSFPQELKFPDGRFSADCEFTGNGWVVSFS